MAIIDKIFPSRFAVLKAFVLLFLLVSFGVRLSLFIWDFKEVDKGVLNIAHIFLTGFLFDLGTLSFFVLFYAVYLVIFPRKWFGSIADRVLTWVGFFLAILIIYFSFFGEFTFWDEFHRRYNFIAVDYLIYTYEVVKNINESYPLPILFSVLLTLVGLSMFLVHRLGFFKIKFDSETRFKQRVIATTPWLVIAGIFAFFITNNQADWSENRYDNELSKAGIYSFFAAFRNNELSYTEFYRTIPENEAFENLKKDFIAQGDSLHHPNKYEIWRTIKNSDSTHLEQKPNVIFICIESLSASFLNSFGNDQNITPTLDSLAKKSVFFTNLYATGTRTVRGMEAITLSIPPTPGRSIVKRKNNQGLFTIGEVFRSKGYENNFFYGGDGYFDNMNTYFGGNGFNIIDRGRGFLLDKTIKTKRTNIEDDEVTFENAWGVCDEDIYNKVLKEADIAYTNGQAFFDFVMTTSNHKPYTYPEDKIDIPSGSSREGAIKYTDFAIREFLKKARTRPWYQNTVFVIMSDHCASSAGKWELDIQNYHIPALVFNAPGQEPTEVAKLSSQIDLFPTLFAMLHWDYSSNLFGSDILRMLPSDERALIGNYRKLGYLKDDRVMVLGDQKVANFYQWNSTDNGLTPLPLDENYLHSSISLYEVADYLYSHDGLKIQQ